ncbi:hypothetical protein L6R52_42525, partial [Myxococcota bacterium]|nr:hypothetical protein [Myxococcota bacterium]
RATAPSGSEVRAAQDPRAEHDPRAQHRDPSEPPSTWVVPPEGEPHALARLPLESLAWTEALDDPDGARREQLYSAQSALRILGIRDVAGLRGLPPAQVASRFGDAGALLVQRALGRRDRPLRAFHPRERVVEELELDAPVEDLEPVLFVLRRIFARLETRLEARGLSASKVALTFSVEPHLETTVEADADRAASSRRIVELELALARPSRKASTMLAIAREKLGSALPGAVRAIVAEVKGPAADRGAQLDLFSAYPKRVEEVSELVGRLRAALGDDAVFSPAMHDTHRPEAAWTRAPFEVERALEERTARPPRATKLEVARPAVLDVPTERTAYMLPEVDDRLSVAEMPDKPEGSVEAVLAELEEKKKSWPKAIQRKVEDEPLPPLPPRPLELFEVPEPATLIAKSPGGADAPGASRTFVPRDADSALLSWRGERIRLRSLSGCERLEAEWWTPAPLAREYMVAEAEDGRKLWVFFDPTGHLFVHGVFD